MPSNRPRFTLIVPLALSIALSTLALSGCGGAVTEAANAPALPAAGDAALYLPLSQYCGTSSSAEGIDWSWEHPYHSTNGNMSYLSNTVISTSGNANISNGVLDLTVGLNDYRGVSGPYVASSAPDTATVMGVRILPLFGRQSVACVSPVSRFQAPPPVYTGLPIDPRTQLPSLVWSSYWNRNTVPVAQAGGYAVDAFEFVGNFSPASASVVFTVPKTRYASVQNMPICFLAPASAQWNCSPATITDRGDYWTLSLNGAQQGVYLLKSPQLNG